MAFIATTPLEQASGEVLEMYRRQQASWGHVPNYAKVFCHRPEVMTRWAALLAGIRRPVEPRRFELVTLAAAHALGNSYCSLAHGRALAEFLTADEIRAVVAGDDSVLPPVEAAMVALARKVAVDAASVTEADVSALRDQGLGEAEIFDVVAVAAARCFFAKLLDGLGAAPDASFLDVDAPLRQSLTVGRAIERAPVQRLADAG